MPVNRERTLLGLGSKRFPGVVELEQIEVTLCFKLGELAVAEPRCVEKVLLARPKCGRRHGEQPRHDGLGGSRQLGVVMDARHESDPVRFVSVELVRQQHQLHGLRHPE